MNRDDDMPKLIKKYRKILRYELKKAVANLAALTAESALVHAQCVRSNLEHQYRKLYYLDNYDVIIIASTETGVRVML